MKDASDAAAAPPTTARYRGFGCAGTAPSTDGPCEGPVTEEVDGLPLCGWHAVEFGAEARADVLEVAALYLSRWLRVAREELCNDELVRRLEAARAEVGAETERSLEALERNGDPARGTLWRTGSGGRGADPRAGAGDAHPAAGTEDAASFRWDRGAGDRR